MKKKGRGEGGVKERTGGKRMQERWGGGEWDKGCLGAGLDLGFSNFHICDGAS